MLSAFNVKSEKLAVRDMEIGLIILGMKNHWTKDTQQSKLDKDQLET